MDAGKHTNEETYGPRAATVQGAEVHIDDDALEALRATIRGAVLTPAIPDTTMSDRRTT